MAGTKDEIRKHKAATLTANWSSDANEYNFITSFSSLHVFMWILLLFIPSSQSTAACEVQIVWGSKRFSWELYKDRKFC